MKTACKIYGEYKINKSMKCWGASWSTSRPEVGLDYLQSQRCQEQELVKLQNALQPMIMTKGSSGTWKIK